MRRERCIGGALLVAAMLVASPDARASIIARPPGAPHTAPTAPGDTLQYYGGRLISNVEIVAVFWTANVNATVQAQIGAFYSAIVKSSYIDWLTEYDSIGKVGLVDMMAGSKQHIGRGTFFGAKTITPINASATLTDADVSAELVAQIQAGHLPPPTLDAGGNVNTLYMIDFPPGVSISLLNLNSCQQFGAYHFTVTINGKSVPYGVHPDCNYDFNTTTLIHSHELIEALTDTEVGLADQMAATTRPIAWATVAATAWASQEIADICENQQDRADIVATYTVQKVWSNYAKACVSGIPICDGVLVAPACRPCNAFDSGNACEGAKPACATQGAKVGRCVACTSAYASACTGATPACDDAKNTCVGCVKSADCKTPATPVCETTTETCRACKIDSECAAGTVCDTSSDAEKGQCVACNTDAQCPGQRCDVTTHRCAPLAPDAGVVTNDGGANGDTGGSDSGCGCDAVGSSSGGLAGGALGIALACVAAARARRRRR